MNAHPNLSKFISLSIMILALTLLCLGGLSRPAEASPTDTTFTVDSPLDDVNPTPDGICKTNEVCTLREAIKEANATPSGNKYIEFASSMDGQIIYLNNSYGSLFINGDHIYIDGPGDVIIDAINLSANTNIFEVRGDYNTIYGLILRGWSDKRYPDPEYGHAVRIYNTAISSHANYNTLQQLIIYSFEHDGILISGDIHGGGHNNTVDSSLIGSADWDANSCTFGWGNGENGIEITNYNVYTTTISYNRIVCNAFSGISLTGDSTNRADHTTIQSNWIGNNNTAAMGNGYAGIADTYSTRTTINDNAISGNSREGIWLSNTWSALIINNHIGVDQNGTVALPNGLSGVVLTSNAYQNTIGSTSNSAWRNIISGNLGCGVEFLGGANYNHLDGNYIGLGGEDGMTVVPNGLAGVCFNGAGSANHIGSDVATVYQFISGNSREGVYAVNTASFAINGDTYIGLKGDVSTAAGNGLEGVKLDPGTTNTSIRPAKVMYNGLAGIAVQGDTSTGNVLTPAAIAYNGGLAIDLGNDGFTPNYSKTPPGPNDWMHYPVFVSYNGSGFTGYTYLSDWVLIYQIIGNPTANQGGGSYLSTVVANAITGNFSYTFPSGVLAVTMQNYDLDTSNCSELSPMVINPNYIKNFLPLVIR